MITLDYTETSWLRQPFSTRVESVTPFLVKFWEGSLRFEPDVDVWIDVNRMELRDVLQEGSFLGVLRTLGREVTTHIDGSRSGLSPIVALSWETMGVDVSFDLNASSSTESNSSWRKGTIDEFLELCMVRTHNVTSTKMEEMSHATFDVQEVEETTSTTITGTVGVDLQQQRKR